MHMVVGFSSRVSAGARMVHERAICPIRTRIRGLRTGISGPIQSIFQCRFSMSAQIWEGIRVLSQFCPHCRAITEHHSYIWLLGRLVSSSQSRLSFRQMRCRGAASRGGVAPCKTCSRTTRRRGTGFKAPFITRTGGAKSGNKLLSKTKHPHCTSGVVRWLVDGGGWPHPRPVYGETTTLDH